MLSKSRLPAGTIREFSHRDKEKSFCSNWEYFRRIWLSTEWIFQVIYILVW